MTDPTHFHLKQSTGWFAAGREIEHALTLLSDAAFKLFLWLCLHAERSCGSLAAPTRELASALHKTEPEIQAALDELFRQNVCHCAGDGMIEVADRFWPYHRSSSSNVVDDRTLYIAHVKRCFLERLCVRSTFTPADEKLAVRLHRDGVSVADVEHAILLGSLRKYAALANNRGGGPITTLYYFTALFDEVRRNPSPETYWNYITEKLRTFEHSGADSPTHQETK
jgi:hypothetical protein